MINTNYFTSYLAPFPCLSTADYWSNYRWRQGVSNFNALAVGDPLRISRQTLPP